MKYCITAILSISFLLFSFNQVSAQTVADDLNDIISETLDLKNNISQNSLALKTLAVDYFVLLNPSPDVSGLETSTEDAQLNVDIAQGNIDLLSVSANSFDDYISTTNYITWTIQLSTLASQIEDKSAELISFIQAGNSADALTAALEMKAALAQQLQITRNIYDETQFYLASLPTYNVRLLLQDGFGVFYNLSSTGLFGLGAQDLFNGEYISTDLTNPQEFSDLRGGTYQFFGYDGYFDGVGQATITLDSSLEGEDGFIEIVLGYWSE